MSPGGKSGDSKWDTAEVKWREGLTLHIEDATLAKKIYDAMWKDQSFRLVIDGNNAVSIPAGALTTHQAADTVDWSSNDLEWDDAGCLVVKDKKLGDRILAAQANGQFRITMDKNAVGATSGPIEGNKVNGLCTC